MAQYMDMVTWKRVYSRKGTNNTGWRPEPQKPYAYYGKKENREKVYRPKHSEEKGEGHQCKKSRERERNKDAIGEGGLWEEGDSEVNDGNQASSSGGNHVAPNLRPLQDDRQLGICYGQG